MAKFADAAQVAVPSAFGALQVVWRETDAGPRVCRVLLPNQPARDGVRLTPVDAVSRSCPVIAALAHQVQRFLEGEAVEFELGLLALEGCSQFQRKVLLAEARVPRGWVSTYGGIAEQVGVPGGARAVGGALAHNPFPIIIPCHRAIRSDGHLGGYQGGLDMKRALLELEGVHVTRTWKVRTDKCYFK